jgi:hypothetical protein
MGGKTLVEDIVAPLRLALQLLGGDVQVLDSPLLFRFAVVNDDLRFSIDTERRSTAGALDFEDFASAIRPMANRSAIAFGCYSLGARPCIPYSNC